MLAVAKVRYVGEAVAAVVAQTRYVAEDAAELIASITNHSGLFSMLKRLLGPNLHSCTKRRKVTCCCRVSFRTVLRYPACPAYTPLTTPQSLCGP